MTDLHALSEAASPGPWVQSPNTHAGMVWVQMGGERGRYGDLEPEFDGPVKRMPGKLFLVRSRRSEWPPEPMEQQYKQREADAAFIVALVNAWRAGEIEYAASLASGVLHTMLSSAGKGVVITDGLVFTTRPEGILVSRVEDTHD